MYIYIYTHILAILVPLDHRQELVPDLGDVGVPIIYIYIYMYTCINITIIYVYIYIYIYVCIYTYIHTHMLYT